MTLREYQTEIVVDTLYEIRSNSKGAEQLNPSLAVQGGKVTVFGSQTKPVSPPTGMQATETNFENILPFAVIPNYLYLEETTPTVASAVLSGINAEEVI